MTGRRTLAGHRARLGLLALLELSSCMAVNVGEEVVDHDYHGTPKRMLVFGTLDSAFSNGAADKFPDAVRNALAPCGVQAEVYAPNHLQLNAPERLNLLIASFKPDTVLLIRQSVRASVNGQVGSGTYVLTLSDVATKRDIWSAEMVLHGPSELVTDRSKGAAMFADRIASRLAAEGVLRDCPLKTQTPSS